MSSKKQIEANRLNARRSTGPRSPEGKAKVARNALKHGLTARPILLPNESREEHSWFLMNLMKELNPLGVLETAFAEKIAEDWWRLRRVPAFEASLHTRAYREALLTQADKSAFHYLFKATQETFPSEQQVRPGDRSSRCSAAA